jgi:hypothetical protein
MLLTIYKNEQGIIDQVKLTAQGPEDSRKLLDFANSEAPGSGTGRWGDHDNWTQHGDGTDYPLHGASYGVEAGGNTLQPGAAIRVLKDDGTVDPPVHTVTSTSGSTVYFTRGGVTGSAERDHVVQVKA